MAYTYDYPRPSVTVDCIVFHKDAKDLKVLLIRRGNPPFKSQWALPGGFVDMDEELEDAAIRELQEETGLKLNGLTQMHTFGKIGRDPRGRTISVVFLGFADKETAQKVKGGDDASDAQWFDVKEVPPLAFDHNEVLKFALLKISS